MLVQGMRYMTGSAAFAERSVCENTAKKNLNLRAARPQRRVQ